MGFDRHGLEVLARDECLRLLSSEPVGRLGLSVDALPVIVPVNFVVDGQRIVVGTGEGSKLDAAMAEAVVCFEVDRWDPVGHDGWSVLVQGPTAVVRGAGDLERCRSLPLRPWGRTDELRYLSVGLELVSGRRLHGAHGGPGLPAAPLPAR